jgi:hypothetical protein
LQKADFSDFLIIGSETQEILWPDGSVLPQPCKVEVGVNVLRLNADRAYADWRPIQKLCACEAFVSPAGQDGDAMQMLETIVITPRATASLLHDDKNRIVADVGHATARGSQKMDDCCSVVL